MLCSHRGHPCSPPAAKTWAPTPNTLLQCSLSWKKAQAGAWCTRGSVAHKWMDQQYDWNLRGTFTGGVSSTGLTQVMKAQYSIKDPSVWQWPALNLDSTYDQMWRHLWTSPASGADKGKDVQMFNTWNSDTGKVSITTQTHSHLKVLIKMLPWKRCKTATGKRLKSPPWFL